MWILGIDTSCDDTGVGLVRDGTVVVNLVASQTLLHQRYGGVVPELASREHTQVIDGLVQQALEEGGIEAPALDLIAATRGPGLIGALLVGYTYGKGLAFALGKPFVAVHHLEGHIYAALAEQPEVTPPFLALIASGGHTHLFEVRSWGNYQLLGATLDDAAGEAFDKSARLLGLGYPGGPQIEQLARQGDARNVPLGVPLQGQEGFAFSFSGLKTAVARAIEKGYAPADIAARFQQVAVEHISQVVTRAAQRTGLTTVLVTGGVAQNAALQAHLRASGLRLLFPPRGLATDNGAMIALAAWRTQAQHPQNQLELPAAAYLPLNRTA
ncbi:MAG: tRNA (adenosine(37)-N6)-threonylcarbamoyltransferase complex transferase subunit TsaD [Meiothermus sp.]|uniref:tRNA (adenosine(37)-N6)-threonylcarbamoyltransferase complex transferase subunit TsaD n=1 Tax=Meiothermus sp. TaxID=1955249 RepID=UPI0025E6F314|nr:tRNA (adenosine(37)-N6)-threonylcarbamoyltransferase complex transferase subunit TsaD [Meiothermus sp.]MCS7068769.1 tRNA (adenosine(37)-N6)-threonylcarbamoyltransferase complex transferase subunit TsaD [Meiothermus sp.]MCX7601324.1 tRNA (adenosine(37)-N6)-threonylcarbamoyltransferase complex transferase subunit TsaD [Meiothermus sp.]MDW8426587.1 tRNA (adenosine(37)-N6)-threonylcarbamoyltransferase complex transferase subunit TsaD [Meiothermus sp.]